MSEYQIEFTGAMPPPAKRSSGWGKFVARALREKPGQWANIGARSRSCAHMIRHGGSAPFQPAGSFEAVTRTRDDGKVDVYARYIGSDNRP